VTVRTLLLTTLLTLSALPAQAATSPAQAPAASAARPTPRPRLVPVVLGDDTLFRLGAGVGAFSASERAGAISARLDHLATARATPARVRVVERPGASSILAGDAPVLDVTDADATLAGVARATLARRWSAVVQGALERRREGVGARSLLASILLALLATGILAGLGFGLRRTYPRLRTAHDHLRASPALALRVQQLELVSSERAAAVLWLLARAVLLLVALALGYAYLAVVFGLFPATQTVADMLLSYAAAAALAAGASVGSYLPRLAALAAIIAGTVLVLRLLRVVFDGLERGALTLPGFYADWAAPTYKLVRLGVLLFAAVLALPNVPGFGSEAFRGVSVFFGLLLSLGSAGAVGNAVAGVLLVYMRPFRVGDRVRIADTEGDVVERTLLVTRVRTIKNVDITVPNAMVLASHIVNYSAVAAERGMIVHTTVTIGYDAPWRLVHELLRAAARATDGILPDPEPFVLQTALNDFYVSYELNAYTAQPARMAGIYSDLHQAIQDRFNEAGVEITSPHFAALRDGNAVALPAEYLPRGYAPGAFRVRAATPPPARADRP